MENAEFYTMFTSGELNERDELWKKKDSAINTSENIKKLQSKIPSDEKVEMKRPLDNHTNKHEELNFCYEKLLKEMKYNEDISSELKSLFINLKYHKKMKVANIFTIAFIVNIIIIGLLVMIVFF